MKQVIDTRRLQSGRVNRGSKEKRVSISVPMTAATKRRIEARALREGVTLAEIVRQAIKAFL